MSGYLVFEDKQFLVVKRSTPTRGVSEVNASRDLSAGGYSDNSQMTSPEGKFLATENTEDTEEMD